MTKEIDDIISKISPYYTNKKNKLKSIPDIYYNLVYDSPSGSLEPIYFFILDFMSKMGLEVEKITDSFASSPGSGHFSELGAKKSQMQEQASKVMATINAVLRSILNLIYDLKEFKIRLSHYDAAKSKEKSVEESANLSLKQIWMDKVDVQRGQGSINALSSGNLQFVTLRDAFMFANSLEDVDKTDLNDRVKRILKPRIQEFLEWKKRSEQELRKRFEIEKIYLKSQVDALKLQSRWARPYLKSAEKLAQDQKLEENAALVTAFNTVLLQLTLLGKKEMKMDDKTTYSRFGGIQAPEEFKKILKKTRKYYSIVFIDFSFIGIPSKIGQHYAFGGKADIKFKSYSLNEEELQLFQDKLNESDLDISLKLIQGMTDDSLLQIKLDIEEFLEEKSEANKEDINPFSALFGVFKSEKKPEKDIKKEKLDILKKKGVKNDSYPEAYVRNFAIADAMDSCFSIYDVFKKSMGMAAFPYAGNRGKGIAGAPETTAERLFGIKPGIIKPKW